MLLVAWHGMIWSNGDRSWWPRLDAARIICFGFQDFQNFPWFWDLQIPVEIFEKFQDSKKLQQRNFFNFFSMDNHWQNIDLWPEFFRPKMMDLLRRSFKWVTFPSWIRPQRDFSGDFFYQGANMIHQCGTVAKFLPFRAQCIHRTWLAIWSSTSLMHQWSFCRLKIRVFSCWNLLRYQHEAQENSKWRSDIREVMLLPTFRMVLGLETDFEPLKTLWFQKLGIFQVMEPKRALIYWICTSQWQR